MDDATINRTIAERLYAVAYLPARTDFASSLDAMAEAEATMTMDELVTYGHAVLHDTDHEQACRKRFDFTPMESAGVERCAIYLALLLGLTAPARTRARCWLAATKGREASK